MCTGALLVAVAGSHERVSHSSLTDEKLGVCVAVKKSIVLVSRVIHMSMGLKASAVLYRSEVGAAALVLPRQGPWPLQRGPCDTIASTHES